jgi:hypothetical protein
MSRFFSKPWGWASAAPLLCALHCAVTPLVVLVAPALAPGHLFEWALLGLSIPLGGWALTRGLRDHGDARPAVPVLLGITLWGISLAHGFHPFPEEISTVVATLIVAGGLIWNSRLQCGLVTDSACGCARCEISTGALPLEETPADSRVRSELLTSGPAAS